jgi:hypothetical protein
MKVISEAKSGAELSALQALLKKLNFITSNTWNELGKLRKNIGFETLSMDRFNKSIANNLNFELSSNDKLYVFCFGKTDSYRLVGLKSFEFPGAFYILGFDWDFSLYNHGS